MICIYHSRDLDGWCSAAIVKKWFKENNPNGTIYNNPYMVDKSIIESKKHEKSLTMFGWDYGDELPNLSRYEQIIMVDISFPIKEITELALSPYRSIIWIDHHISAINAWKDGKCSLEGLRDTKFAACELTWKYFFPNEKMSEFVRLLGRYDSFQHKGTNEEEKVLMFQYAARAKYKNPDDCLQGINDDIRQSYFTDRMLDSGKAIYGYLCTEAEQDYKDKFDIILTEDIYSDQLSQYPVPTPRKFACINKKRFNPINFGIDYHKDGYDGFACFHYANRKYNFSLYNDNGNVDCSVIAKSFGGGGHKGASGFVIDDLSKVIK